MFANKLVALSALVLLGSAYSRPLCALTADDPRCPEGPASTTADITPQRVSIKDTTNLQIFIDDLVAGESVQEIKLAQADNPNQGVAVDLTDLRVENGKLSVSVT